ncbi:MAG: hypothetical protein GXY86_09610 [Firmicutes bacterium]|nr:hypothetical protein [Bacillota bacterium]
MIKLINDGTKNQLIRRALFGKSVKTRMRALLLLAHDEAKEGGWLLETALKLETFFRKQ